MTADRWSDLLAFLAGVVGLVVVVRTWPRRPRRAQIARLRHPSTPPPVGVVLDVSGGSAHWRVVTAATSLPTTVDIVTWQQVGTDDWRSEPIVDPIVLEPGGSAVLPLAVDHPASPHLVVIAWTVRHPGGDVQGSRTMTIGTTSPTVPAAVPAPRGWAPLVASALIAGLLVVLVLVAGWRVIDGDDDGDLVAPSPIATAPSVIPSTAIPSTAIPSTAPARVQTSVPTPTTTPTTTATTTTATAPATTTAATATATTIPTTTTATITSTTTPPATGTPQTGSDGRSIDVRGRIEDCRFGADCIIASFSAVGFPSEGEYVCEFADGSRFTFRYAGGGAIDACATSGESPSITIEIDDVRSATITRDAPDGA